MVFATVFRIAGRLVREVPAAILGRPVTHV
jgi:hypothetical protein